jgi:hypothetical protein
MALVMVHAILLANLLAQMFADIHSPRSMCLFTP